MKTRLSFYILLILLSQSLHSFAFIGGVPSGPPSGVAKIGIMDFIFGSCTATVVSPWHILTATHCFGRDPEMIFNFNEIYPDPFSEVIELLQADGSLKQVQVKVKRVHFYPQAFYGGDPERVPGFSLEEKFVFMVSVGDIAIVELAQPLHGIQYFPKVLIENPNQNPIWTGGFGWKVNQHEGVAFGEAKYTGRFAQFGSMRNAFYFEDDERFPKESLVSIEMKYPGNEYSYISKGDSGGGVFRKIGNETFVVGVNHGGHIQYAGDLKIDPMTGKVLAKPKAFGEIVGFAHIFSPSNPALTNWMKSILPASSIGWAPKQ